MKKLHRQGSVWRKAFSTIRFGFVVLRQVFSHNEIKIIDRDFDTLMIAGCNGERFDNQETQEMNNVLAHRTDFKHLMRWVSDAAEQLLGPGTIITRIGANSYIGDTGSHADLGWHPSMVGG